MSDFSDRPFLAGDLIGLRAFSVDNFGRLTGPSRGGVFKPGVNEGKCLSTPLDRMQRDLAKSMSRWTSTSPGGLYGDQTPPSAESTTGAERESEHVVGNAQCGCGFYAYFNGDNDYATAGTVSALIRGSGVVTIGGKGFRASKAELVGLVLPNNVARWRAHLHYWQLQVLVGVATLLAAGSEAWEQNWLYAGINSVFAALWFFWSYESRKRVKSKIKVKSRVARMVAANYPDVPTFATVKAAVKAHPLTPPAPPRPEDPDFWTRDA